MRYDSKMIFTFLKVSAVLFVIFVAYHLVRFRSLINTGVALSDAAHPFERLKADPKMRILVMGDSTAVGTGVIDPNDSTAGRLGAYYPDAELVNLGVNGLRVAGLVEKIKNVEGKFDLVLIQIGGNDITHRTQIADVERDLRVVLAKAKTLAPKVLLLHTGNLGAAPIWPPIIGPYMVHRTMMIRDLYLRVAPELGVIYVDLYGAGVDTIFAKDLVRYYATDSFHLSGAGYGVWFDVIKQSLAK